MDRLQPGRVGIVPSGALGVSLFYHLTRQLTHMDGTVFFLEREGSASAQALRRKGEILVADAEGMHRLPTSTLLKPDLLEVYQAGELPEIVLVCSNPDQLLGMITTSVKLLERIYENGQLEELPLPKLVLSANGIYFQRIRQIFLEKIEEATLLGRLPDLWPHLMPRIVGRLLRGVTIQTGLREGSGEQAIYWPGPRGITRLAGGDLESRERCWQVLAGRGAWFELAAHSSATRLEFDKAMVNLSTNLLGQLYAIDAHGHFHLLTIEEILVPKHEPEVRELTEHVFRIGQAVKAYGLHEDFEKIFSELLATCRMHLAHVPSSLQWVALRLRLGELEPRLTPTESWLIDPLIRYAHSAGLETAAHYFQGLKEKLARRLRLAIQARQRPSASALLPTNETG